MKNTIKKIVATISAAAMCAVPMSNALSANAYANANARYTFRKTFAVSSPKNIKRLVFGVACSTSGTNGPVAHKIANGTLETGAGGGVGVHNAGGTFYPSNRNMVGGMVSVHMVCNSPSDYHEYSTTNYAYAPNGSLIPNAVSSSPTFLVGDIDLDNDIDEADYQILFRGIYKKTVESGISAYKFSYFEVMNVAVGGSAGNYSAYSFDINNDGYLSNADLAMFSSYLDGTLTRFPM